MEMFDEDCNTINGLTMQPYIPWIFDTVFWKPGCFFVFCFLLTFQVLIECLATLFNVLIC